jgi:hypothetical protein
MIIVKLKGGLGNQLFQYAFGRALAARTGAPLRFDLRYYFDGPPAPFLTYGLGNFDCRVEIATESDLRECVPFGVRGRRLAETYGTSAPPLSARLLNYHWELQWPSTWARFDVPRRWRFDPGVFDVDPPAFFNGYWQTERYFADVSDALRREITVDHELAGENRRLAAEIDDSTAVAMHVRRGDYVDRGDALPATYFERALSTIGDQVPEPHVYVFSDDIEWTRRNVSIPYPTTFVTHNDSETDYEDLRLMRLCDHAVISNSTFSWWGAWLNDTGDKRVVAPGYWYDGNRTAELDVVPDRWTVVETDVDIDVDVERAG